jgi:hypothetical protein
MMNNLLATSAKKDSVNVNKLEEEVSTTKKGIIESMMDNPLFTGGAGLMGFGLVLSFGRKISLIGSSFLKRRFISSLEVDNTDQ